MSNTEEHIAMADNNDNPAPIMAIESVSAVFAHDISTPLATAQMNANVLAEHMTP